MHLHEAAGLHVPGLEQVERHARGGGGAIEERQHGGVVRRGHHPRGGGGGRAAAAEAAEGVEEGQELRIREGAAREGGRVACRCVSSALRRGRDPADPCIGPFLADIPTGWLGCRISNGGPGYSAFRFSFHRNPSRATVRRFPFELVCA